MKKTFWFGALGYGLIELLWRGRTHPSMLLTGGACLCMMKKICAAKRSIFRLTLRCSVLITVMEFLVGLLVNRLWKMNVWDYSSEKGNLLGQICPKYCSFWFALSLPFVVYYKKEHKA